MENYIECIDVDYSSEAETCDLDTVHPRTQVEGARRAVFKSRVFPVLVADYFGVLLPCINKRILYPLVI